MHSGHFWRSAVDDPEIECIPCDPSSLARLLHRFTCLRRRLCIRAPHLIRLTPVSEIPPELQHASELQPASARRSSSSRLSSSPPSSVVASEVPSSSRRARVRVPTCAGRALAAPVSELLAVRDSSCARRSLRRRTLFSDLCWRREIIDDVLLAEIAFIDTQYRFWVSPLKIALHGPVSNVHGSLLDTVMAAFRSEVNSLLEVK